MKTLKKSISIILCVLMIMSSVMIFSFAKEPKVTDYIPDYDMETPVIFIHGMGQNDTYLVDENGNKKVDKDGKYITGWPLYLDVPALIKNALPGLLMSIVTRKDSGLYDGLYNGAIEALNSVAKDNEGNYINPITLNNYPYSFAKMSETEKEECYEHIPIKQLTELIGEDKVFYFGYDTFGNVSETAEILHNYINDIVLPETGAKQVTLCTISLGGSITVEHLNKYPEDHKLIKKLLFFVPAINGSDIVGDILTEELSVFYDDSTLYESLMVKLLGDSFGAYLLNMVLRILPSDVLKSGLRGLVNGVAEVAIRSCTQMWALCPDEYYEEAREKWLSDEKYASIRAQVDSFMQSRANFENNLNKLREGGTELYNIVCYGSQLFPLSKNYKTTNADGIIDAASTSMGMTFADLGTTFPDGYKAAGTYCKDPTHNHISPDNTVDPTTGLLPCTTWFFKGQPHDMLASNDVAISLSVQILTDNNMKDVYSNPEAYPQYNNYRLTKNANLNIDLWNETDKTDISADKIDAVNKAIADVRAIEEETVIDNARWLAAEKALTDSLVAAGVIESEEPTEIENIFTLITKGANKCVNKFYEVIK